MNCKTFMIMFVNAATAGLIGVGIEFQWDYMQHFGHFFALILAVFIALASDPADIYTKKSQYYLTIPFSLVLMFSLVFYGNIIIALLYVLSLIKHYDDQNCYFSFLTKLKERDARMARDAIRCCDKICDHKHWTFNRNGRFCPDCRAVMIDFFGD